MRPEFHSSSPSHCFHGRIPHCFEQPAAPSAHSPPGATVAGMEVNCCHSAHNFNPQEGPLAWAMAGAQRVGGEDLWQAFVDLDLDPAEFTGEVESVDLVNLDIHEADLASQPRAEGEVD